MIFHPNLLVINSFFQSSHVRALRATLNLGQPVGHFLVLALQHLQTDIFFLVGLADQVFFGPAACPAGGADGVRVIRVVLVTGVARIFAGFTALCGLVVVFWGQQVVRQFDCCGAITAFLHVQRRFFSFCGHGISLNVSSERQRVIGDLGNQLVIIKGHE